MKKQWLTLIVLGLFAVAGWWLYRATDYQLFTRPIKVGILHSLTGTMAVSEKPVVDATRLAIEEINAQGGVLQRPLEPIVVDGASDWPTFAREAERLITEEKVSVVFGCWTSASRKTVKPIFEKYGHLLFYPVQYEGVEQSPNIVYTGAAPNQQIIPGVKWAFDHLGKRFFLVGSDYVFPHMANHIIAEQMAALDGEIVGEEYIPLGSRTVQGVIQRIHETKPEVILNTINGDSNLAFFAALRAAGITPEKIPTMSFSIAENELSALGVANMVGDYATWNYFQSIASHENMSFVERFQARYGANRVVADPMEAGYISVHLWKQAVEEAGTDEVSAVQQTIGNQSLAAPEGIVFIDPDNKHTWKIVRVGQIRNDGQFDIVWSSEKPVRPVPYPVYQSPSEWNGFLEDLYNGWGKQWASSREG